MVLILFIRMFSRSHIASICTLRKKFPVYGNLKKVRQTRSPLFLSHFEITDSGLTVEIIDNRHHTRLSIPRTEYGTIRPPILHNHDYFELMFVLRGKLKIQIEETVYTYQAGDACLFDQNIHHAELERQNTSIIYCCITTAFLNSWPGGSTAYDLSGSKCLQHFFQNSENQTGSSNQFAEFRNAETRGADKNRFILRSVREELLRREPGSWLIICGLFCRLLNTLADPKFYTYRCITLKSESLVDQIRLYIESAPGRVNREEISSAMHYSSDYLNRVFRQRTGMTLSAYCTYTYMKKAASLLLQTDDTVEEIAAAVGFSNPSQFYRQFRNFFHVTPQTYRSLCSKILDSGEADWKSTAGGSQFSDSAFRISSDDA